MNLTPSQISSGFLKGDSDTPFVVILNIYGTGLGIARDLSSLKIPIIGINSNATSPGFFSKFCHCIVGPDSVEDPQSLFLFLLNFKDNFNHKPILFPTRDGDLEFIEVFRVELEKFFILPHLKGDLLDLVMNKERLAQWALSNGFSAPSTLRISSSDDLNKKWQHLIFPLVVKPVKAADWKHPKIWEGVGKRKAIKVHSLPELQEIYSKVSYYHPDVLLQEWVSGEESSFYILGAYFNSKSECLGGFTAQKICQFPPFFGLGCLVMGNRNEKVFKLGIDILRALNFKGMVEIEFKKDLLNGEYKLIEINPRHWDQHGMGTLCGVNLSLLAFQDLSSRKIISKSDQSKSKVYWINETGFIWTILHQVKSKNFSWLKWIFPLLFRRKTFSLWSWKDPGPFLKFFRF